ncbi:pyrroline-5-carboxylate reductase [Salipaludibacillus aurantiacus]|uniref:Pyrroline-5-carboxylate reductase n=1 Tax=Salipaludibacillus aurantiacus TaxID=1601833 RepID=A0A1H9WM99_9BACI|nr:pyrroline-5-carboxylate reductase [Salipaludibacillus aurantiacus]SES34807.1 pyrroline-5-carboxylate reductase [Salipaludibacillus aurantiacus]
MVTKLLFIGAGRMAEAIISGLTEDENNGFTRVTVSNRADTEKLERLKNTYGVEVSSDWKTEVNKHDAILLASPPHTHNELLRQLSGMIEGQFIITVAAGIDPSYMEARLPDRTPAAWIMPNTGAQIGQSMSTFACGNYVEENHRKILYKILSAIGEAEELPEEQVHDLTAITGSAPAFLYAFAEALEEAAVSYEVSPDQARKLVTHMLKGSASMLEKGESPQTLMQQVASPGGSTAEGLRVLEKENFGSLVKKAVKATNDHARGGKD